MRFLHTADWQIGMRAGSVGEAGERVRQQRLLTAERVVQIAQDRGAEFILLAGDTFEDNGVDRSLVQKVGDILSAFPTPVHIIPGNHDPAVPGSVWEHPVWASHANLRVIVDNAPVQLDGGHLYACPIFAKHSSSDPTAWITPEQTDGIRIGLAHGTVEGIRQDEPDYPIARDTPERSGLDYVALGHWHSTAIYESAAGTSRMAYSGTHEPTRFGERDSGSVLLVEIANPGEVPRVEQVKAGALTWHTLAREVDSDVTLASLREEIEILDDSASTLIEVTLSGLLPASAADEVARIEEITASRFLFGRVDTSSLLPSPEDDAWLSALPVGVVRDAAERLRQVALSGAEQSGTASRALLELYRLAMEATA